MQGASVHLPQILRKWRRRSMGYQELSATHALGCYPTCLKRKTVTVVVGKEKKTFKVKPQVLECCQFQSLLEKATIEDKEYCIFLGCDAILFEHLLWLVHTHDPSLRSLNVELLMEFYAQESDEHNTKKLLLQD